MAELTDLVPFGKYNGRPVAELIQDRKYCEWLAAQPWFGQKFASLKVLVLDAGHGPQDTPEHNRLQAWFLDPQFRLAIVRRLFPEREAETSIPRFEIAAWDVEFWAEVDKLGRYYFDIECKPLLGDDYPAVMRQIKKRDPYRRESRQFIEILLVEQFSSEVIGRDELRAFFATSDIHVVFVDDLEVAR